MRSLTAARIRCLHIRVIGEDIYELAKILGHSNIKMSERYAKLGKEYIAGTRSTARAMWKLMEGEAGKLWVSPFAASRRMGRKLVRTILMRPTRELKVL